ncbi:MAG: hypothetical protein IJS53_03730 [Clostridia bacterium]|nr:hypothetical protein [Clostridia bacterium]
MYKLELHCHSSEVSVCSSCPAEREIALYRAAGYGGIVTTNHFNRGTFRGMEGLSWPEKVAHFMRGYAALKDAAGADFDVLLGCEINLTPLDWPAYIPNDYLVYGVTEEWLLSCGDVRALSLAALSEKARAAGMLLIQAHPFREGMVMQDEALLDGFEVFNGNPDHDSHNDLAAVWGAMTGKIRTSGTDLHHARTVPCGGIATRERIRDNETLLSVLRSGAYTLLP